MNKQPVIAAMATAALFLGGCGGDDDADDAAPEPSPSEAEAPSGETPDAAGSPEPETEPTTDETEPPPEEDNADVQVDESSTLGIAETSLGTILVAGDGLTLYIFDSDEQGTSTCTGQCASSWPPLTVDGDPVPGESIDQALLDTIERDDGSQQVTYNGWPLYNWAQDGAPGDVNGQGVNGIWWVIGPDGTPIRE